MISAAEQHRRAILVGAAAFSVIVATLAAVFAWHNRETALQNGLNLAAVHARQIEDQATQSMHTADVAIGSVLVQDLGTVEMARASREFRAILRHAPFIRSLSVLDSRQRIIASSNPANLGRHVDTANFFPAADNGRSFLRIGLPWTGRDFADGTPASTGNPGDPKALGFISIARAGVWAGTPVTFLVALNPESFVGRMQEIMRPQLGSATLVRYDGTTLLGTEDAPAAASDWRGLTTWLNASSTESGLVPPDFAPEKSAVFRASRAFPFLVVVRLDRGFALRNWEIEARALALVAALLVVLALVSARIHLRRYAAVEMERMEAERLRVIHSTVFESSADAIIITDANANIISANPAFVRSTGYSAREVIGKNPRLLGSGRHGKEFYQAMWAKLLAQGVWQGDMVNRRKDGALFDVYVRITAYKNAAGELLHYIGVSTDVTERRRAEEALVVSEERFRQLTLLSSDWYWEQDTEFRFVRMDGAVEDASGITAQEHLGKTRWDLEALNITEQDWAAHKALLAARLPFYDFEMRRPDKNGREHWVSVSGVAIFDKRGAFLGYRGVGKDISQRKQYEALLIESEARQRAILENEPECITLVDTDSVILDINPAGVALVKADSRESLIGRTILDFVAPEFKEALADFHAHVEEGQTRRGEYQLLDSGGRRFWAEGSAVCISYRGHRSVLAVTRDIDEKRKAERDLEQYRAKLEEMVIVRTSELAEAKDAAEMASRAKSRFLSAMSHELRTPLNGVMGMTALAQRLVTDPKQGDFLKKAMGAAEHLLGVINNILDLSKIEADRVVLESKDFSLGNAIASAIEVHQAAADEKKVRVEWEIDPRLPRTVCGDSFRLSQILHNYVGNAVKFSDGGMVAVLVSKVDSSEAGVFLKLEVTDQGPGLSEEEQELLFVPFSQTDDSMTRRFGGTGLGLAIVKRLAGLMGGDVGVLSKKGFGSTFWATVRLGQARESAEEAIPGEQVDVFAHLRLQYSGACVLVAEDEPVNQEVIVTQLRDAGLLADLASNGREALAMARMKDYDLVLMDMQMPLLNGLDATREIRKSGKRKNVPIIAMTANAFAEDRARCLAAGMDEHLGKPIAPQVLAQTLVKWLGQGATAK